MLGPSLAKLMEYGYFDVVLFEINIFRLDGLQGLLRAIIAMHSFSKAFGSRYGHALVVTGRKFSL